MKSLIVNTIGIIGISVGILMPNKTITIELTNDEAKQYSQSMDKLIAIINDSDMVSGERKECKKLILSANTLLSSKIKVDSLKKK